MDFSSPIENLIEEFERLPGIGRKTAQRLAFHVLDLPTQKVDKFADALKEAKAKIKNCTTCYNLTSEDPCKICRSAKRDPSIIMVVQSPRDVFALERIKEYRGLYHVLHGAISPINGIGPEEIKIKELLARLKDDTVKEIILATNPNIEGEATAMYIARLVSPFGILVTRIAHGIPIGSDLEYADEITLARSLEGRRPI